MLPRSSGRASAALLAGLAALLWASYYPIVLALAPSVSPAAMLVVPFLAGGAIFALSAVRSGHGRVFLTLWREPSAWLRAGFAATMQLATLAATYTSGPVDTSLLALLGDVVASPLLLLFLFREGRERIGSAAFLAGLGLCLAGGVLTIAGGRRIAALSGWAWPVALAVPIAIALYFVLTARAARTTPQACLNAQAFLGAGLLTLLLSPWIPGGPASLGFLRGGPLLALLALGLIVFFLGPYLYFLAIERAGLVLAALLMVLIPVFTLALSIAFLHLPPTLLGAAGVAVAVVGALVALQGDHPPWVPSYRPGGTPPAEQR